MLAILQHRGAELVIVRVAAFQENQPARGVGQALRTTYMPAKSNMPQDIQELLDRLDGAGTDRA